MGLRDLGYKAYEGDRRAAETNIWVLLRHGLRRAWGSWFVKAAAFLCWAPPLAALGAMGFVLWINEQMRLQGSPQAQDIQVAYWVYILTRVQFWGFVTLISAGAGASVIAEDRRFGAFQFYFAKPVTAVQYLVGRVSAVTLWCFLVTFLPAALLVVEGIALAPPQLRLERGGLLLPALLYSGTVAVVMACASVGVSALSKSRTLTMSGWAMALLIPTVVGWIVETVADTPWLSLFAILRLLDVVGTALFKIETEESLLKWYHATPALIAIAVAAVALAFRRVNRAEVIT